MKTMKQYKIETTLKTIGLTVLLFFASAHKVAAAQALMYGNQAYNGVPYNNLIGANMGSAFNYGNACGRQSMYPFGNKLAVFPHGIDTTSSLNESSQSMQNTASVGDSNMSIMDQVQQLYDEDNKKQKGSKVDIEGMFDELKKNPACWGNNNNNISKQSGAKENRDHLDESDSEALNNVDNGGNNNIEDDEIVSRYQKIMEARQKSEEKQNDAPSDNKKEPQAIIDVFGANKDKQKENAPAILCKQIEEDQQNILNQLKINNNQNKAAEINEEINKVASKQAADNAVDESNQAVENAQRQLGLKNNQVELDKQYKKVLQELKSEHTALKNKNNLLAQEVNIKKKIVDLKDANNALRENNEQLIEKSKNLDNKVSMIQNDEKTGPMQQKASQQTRDNVQLYFALSVIIVSLVYFINSLYKMLFSKQYVVGA